MPKDDEATIMVGVQHDPATHRDSIVVMVDQDRAFALESEQALVYAMRVLSVAHLARWCAAVCRGGIALGVNNHAVAEMSSRLAGMQMVEFIEPLTFRPNVLLDRNLQPVVEAMYDGQLRETWTPSMALDFASDLVDCMVNLYTVTAMREVVGSRPDAYRMFVELLPTFIDAITTADVPSPLQRVHDSVSKMVKDMGGSDGEVGTANG